MTPARLSTVARFSPARPVLVELRSARRTCSLFAFVLVTYVIPAKDPGEWWHWILAVAWLVVGVVEWRRASRVGNALDGVSA